LVNFLERPAQKETGESKPIPTAAPVVETKVAVPPAPASSDGRSLRRKMSPLRKKIAAQLVMAQQNAAMLTTFNECDMTAVMRLRSSYQEAFQKSMERSWVYVVFHKSMVGRTPSCSLDECPNRW